MSQSEETWKDWKERNAAWVDPIGLLILGLIAWGLVSIAAIVIGKAILNA